MTDYYRRSIADVPPGLHAAEWEFLCRYNDGRLRQDLLEFLFGPEPLKAALLATLWALGCPLTLLAALVVASLLIYALLRRLDRGRLAEARRIAAKMVQAAAGTPVPLAPTEAPLPQHEPCTAS